MLMPFAGSESFCVDGTFDIGTLQLFVATVLIANEDSK